MTFPVDHWLSISYSACNFPFLDVDVLRTTSCGVYISQLVRFARVSNRVTDFNARNEILTANFLHQGYRYHKLKENLF